MIQAEIGGAARVTPGFGVQKPGCLIRDFTLMSSRGENLGISSFRSRSNLAVVFPGISDAMLAFAGEAVRHASEFSEQDTTVLVVVPHGPESEAIAAAGNSPVIVLYDETHHAYRLSGAMDESARPIPVVYLTDRFGEIAETYVAPDRQMPPSVAEILSALEFLNYQCPECEPPEWPQ